MQICRCDVNIVHHLPMVPYIPTRLLKGLKVIPVLILLYLILYYLLVRFPDLERPRYRPQRIVNYVCPSSDHGQEYEHYETFSQNESALTESRILVLLENVLSRHGRLITHMLNASKCPYKIDTFSKNLPLLTTSTHGRYSTIIIENFNRYLNLPKWNRQLLDKYSQDYKVPIVSFLPGRAQFFSNSKVRGMNLTIWHNQKALNIRFSPSSIIPYIARPNVILPFPVSDGREWTLFEDSINFESVVVVEDIEGKRRAAVIRDKGSVDGVEKIIFGHNLTEWIIGMGFIDALRWSTKCRCGCHSLDRFIQIDIDDIFVGARGTRMTSDDVEALIQSQDKLRNRISNFSYLLGYSGAFFLHGDDLEDEGDRMIIEKAANFMWFPHMWKHNHPQDHNESFLESTMIMNKQFGEMNNLRVPFEYAISPQHGGVYPVHTALFNAWKKVWGVKVTSTEEYPHFRPWGKRKGFIHRGIEVLPRQTCGLYTHTQLFHLYPGGIKKLTSLIEGGDLFWTIALNPISIFMTHQQNYAHDRLAPYTFENVISFLECWTRFRLRWEDPISVADRYFHLFPTEKNPIWGNPCMDERHRSILPPTLNCSNLTLPNLLVVGPQKTGTTALSSFLQLHPDVSTNRILENTFEEIQFFSGENYEKGFDWYRQLFNNGSSKIVMDKSATYWDSTEGPMRAFALIPFAKIVVILHDPILRAYSWYNHLVARNESIVRGLSMEDVLNGDTPAAKKIRSRCISGGRYAHHLDRWLQWFPPSQFHLIDGSELKENPSEVVTNLARWLQLSPFDFQSLIKFNPKKGFYCKIVSGHSSCLGASKGRSYPPISPILSSRLCSIFHNDNIALHKMLLNHNFPVPTWLSSSLNQC
ncbi:hst-1 [Pristionchus pacificus]|uniref:[heparan sulfate]-glucosamine N-sulfotransferase n=1 Tax=Pristionchus pacificus TaxID=54126 RepID=A0A8R1URJ7_PRIPA|nr:hst-1 [Pristionchus pacificus]